MPGDGVVSIGATFDKTNVDAGLGETQEMVKASMDAIATSIVEANAKSKAAWRSLGEEVKNAAAIHNVEALKVAEATREVASAQADLRRATLLSKDAKIDDAQRTAVLASAQTNLAAKSAELSAAKREEAEAFARAAEEEALSSNWVVAAFQRMSIQVRESLGEVQEKLLQVAEQSGIEAEGITAGFSGLTKLFGAGIAVGFAAEYVDGLAKINVELDHLATKSGLSITSLAGLQQILKEAGGDFEAVATGLVRMESNVQKLSEGKSVPIQLADAFTNLGLNIDDVRRAKAPELLQMIATAMANETDQNIRANSAITIFGRGGQALIPILREQGEQLSANMDKEGKLTGITNESAEAARRWTQDVARLSSEFRSVMMPVMEHAEDVILGVAGACETAAALIVSVFETIATVIVSMFAPLVKLGALMRDLFTRDWAALKTDAQGASSAFADTWKAGFAEIKANWAEVYHTFAEKSEVPAVPKGEDTEGGDLDAPATKTRRNVAFQADKQQLDEIKLDHQVTLEEEIDFWKKKLAVAKKGSDEYKSIVATLAPLEQKEDKKPKVDTSGPETQSPDMSGAIAESITGMQEEVKEAQRATREQLQAYREMAEEKIRLAHEDYIDAERNANFEVEMGRMTETKRIAVLRQAALQENQIRQQQSKYVEMLDSNDLKRYEADLKKEEEDTREFNRQMQQSTQQTALQNQKIWKEEVNTFNQGITQMVNDWMKGSKNIEKDLAQMFQKMLEQMADFVLQNILKHAEMWAELKIQQLLGLTTQKATQAAANVATVTSDAGVAAAGAMAYYSASDPVAAPALAAAQYAMTISYGSMAAFAAGGVVQGGGGMGVPILAHAGERVLSPSQTSNFEKMVNQNAGSGTVNNHLHYEPKVNGNNRAQMRSDLRDHADTIMDIVRSGYRSGALTA